MINPQKTTLALLAGAAAFSTLAPTAQAQSSDGLIDKLVEKGILTVKEAQDLRDESDKDFRTAVQSFSGMPDWVTGYKFTGDFRGRYDQYSTPSAGGNPTTSSGQPVSLNNGIDHIRLRYRLRFGVTVNMRDNLEAGFRLGSGDPKGSNGGGNALSNSSTLQQGFDQKPVYIDTAYGKWTIVNNAKWELSAAIGKMDSPFHFTPMVFDQDLTPEGVQSVTTYHVNDRNTLELVTAAYVLNDSYWSGNNNGNGLNGSKQSPFLYGGEFTWTAKWSPKWTTALGGGALEIVNAQGLNADIAYNSNPSVYLPLSNLGNSRNSNGEMLYNFVPLIADASATYNCDTFPFYQGVFPIKFQAEFIDNIGAPSNNRGYWGGITFGKAGTKGTWELAYRYEYLESDAWYDQLTDDDNVAFYPYSPVYEAVPGSSLAGIPGGYVGGTNIKGHLFRLTYNVTDAMSVSFICYLNKLINENPYSSLGVSVSETQSTAIHFMADANWKF